MLTAPYLCLLINVSLLQRKNKKRNSDIIFELLTSFIEYAK